LSILNNKKILVIVTGSIAAYKACTIVRLLCKQGANVQVMLSQSAQKFITKEIFEAFTKNKVITKLFNKEFGQSLEHINLAIDLDCIVVVPATANILNKVANGIADCLVSTTLSVCEQPILFVPAMNYRMWQNPATISSITILKKRGKQILTPEYGDLASLHKGEGRLPNNTKIMNSIRGLYKHKMPLKGKKVLITAGPTYENIDPVRYITNRSTGRMGYAIAEKARDFGASVLLISGPTNLNSIPEVNILQIKTSEEMYKQVKKYSKQADYIFMVAAVSDYTPIKHYTNKIKKKNLMLNLLLKPNPDILQSIANQTNAVIIGFALETNQGEANAIKKLYNKGADYIVLNYANRLGEGFESSTNKVTIFSKNKIKINLKMDRKDRIAEKIIKFVINYK